MVKQFGKYFKTLFCTVLMLGAGSVFVSAQTVQQGVVMEYHDKSSKTPLGNVAIAATNAGATTSDATGAFTLSFRTLKPGDGIQFRRIEKQGYEVMNKEAVEVMRVGSKGNADAVKIVLCSSQLLNQLREGYRSVSVQRYEKQLKQAEAEAKRLKEQGQLKEDEYNARLDELEAEYEEKLSTIDTYIDRFARIDLTELDETERRIIALVQEGKFDEAMEMYEQQGFVQKLQKSREEQRQLAEAKTKIESAIDAKAEEADRLRQSIDRQVNLLRMAGGKENLDKVHEILKEVFLADETNVEARKAYALSLFQREQTTEATNLLKEGISITNDLFEKALMYIDVAEMYDMQTNYSDCYEYAKLANEIIPQIKDSNYKVATRIAPSARKYMLKHHIREGNWKECESIEKLMKQEWEIDTLNVSSLFDYIYLLYVLNEYYSMTSNHNEALWAVREEVSLDEMLYKISPWSSTIYKSYASACSTYWLEGLRAEAKDAAHQAVAYGNQYLEKNPLPTFIIESLDVYYTALDVLTDMGEYEEAERVLSWMKNFNVFGRLAHMQNPVVSEYQGLIRMSEALVILHRGNMDEAEQLTEKAYNTMMKNEDGEYAATLLRHSTLGLVQQQQRKYDEAKKNFTQAITIAEQTYRDEPDAWNADTYCRYLVHYADLMGQMKKKGECKKYLKQASKVAAFECDNIKINEVKKKYNIK